MRETLYSPPDGEGPSVVRETTCKGCKHLDAVAIGSVCGHPTQGYHLLGFTTTTPSWCPIVSADPEGWDKRLSEAVAVCFQRTNMDFRDKTLHGAVAKAFAALQPMREDTNV